MLPIKGLLIFWTFYSICSIEMEKKRNDELLEKLSDSLLDNYNPRVSKPQTVNAYEFYSNQQK